MALAATRPSVLYSPDAASQPPSPTASLAVWLWIGHFVKRELETLFVHVFSRPTMPLFNLVKNSWYYWAFAAFVAYPLCHPEYTSPDQTSVTVGAALMVVSEVVNLAVHLQFKFMRNESVTSRNAPSGPLFALVSCPNYTAEVRRLRVCAVCVAWARGVSA